MQSIRNIFTSLFILGGFVALFSLLHAQETATQDSEISLATNEVSAMSDLQVEEQAIEMTTPVAATNEPLDGTFYSAQNPDSAPAPENVLGVPVWPVGDGVYLLDDLNVDYSTSRGMSLARGGLRAMDLPDPGDGSGDGGTFSPMFSVPDYNTNLWLEITNLADNTAGILISNTEPDIQYEIQGIADLTDTNWISEGFVLGSEITNWTPTSVAATNYPNLFLRVRSWQDSDGSGLPDWWQLQNFGHLGVDPNADPDGDGWSNIQEFQNGTNPNSFNTPPTPQGLTATYHSSSDTATISWQSSPAPVTGYTVQDSDGATFSFSAGTEDFEDNLSADVPNGYYIGDPTIYKTYQVQAHYAGGDSAWSAPASLDIAQSFSAAIIAGQTNVNLAVSVFPADTVAIRVRRIDEQATGFHGDTNYNATWDIPVSSFTNGIYPIPDAWAPVIDGYGFGDYAWWIQAVSANGDVSTAVVAENDFSYWTAPPSGGAIVYWPAPFFDGRVQLKQNLIFQLRAATVDFPFTFSQPPSTAYAYAGIFLTDIGVPYQNWFFDQYKPVKDNYLFRNFVFDSSELDAYGRTTTGAGGDYSTWPYTLTLSNNPTYQFVPPATFSTTLPALLATNQTRWLVSYPLDSPIYNVLTGTIYDTPDLAEIGCDDYYNTANSTSYCQMFGGVKNVYGLPFVSATMSAGGTPGVVSAGNTFSDAPYSYFYPETAQPLFQTEEYDFWIPEKDWLPGQSGFAVTNKSRLMISNVGLSLVSGDGGNGAFSVAAYAKLSLQNGYSGVYGYLQQYFDKAYKIDTNGIVTTNTTGILSPYGSFFATEPGPTALVTMPDVDTGERGTATVYAVSLQLDANHDGNMDLNFNSADATSGSKPDQIWVNNNYDRSHSVDVTDTEQDDLQVVYGFGSGLKFQIPDYDYTTSGVPAIPCPRDLEDYFRLWTPGIAALMKVLPSNYTVQLTLSGSGQIRVFQAVEPNGGTNYLFDETTASNQVASATSLYVGLLSSSSPIVFNISTNFDEHFIFCGVTNGSAQIDLQVLDGNLNVVADAPAYLQINDIKQMYERWTLGDNPNLPVLNVATNATDGLQVGASPFRYLSPQDTNTPYILFVHGWNMPLWEKDRYAETAFKRLYWQGYQGRFGEFRWPTYYDFPFGEASYQAIDTRNFDNSESNAWASAAGLLEKLTDLNAQYPDQVYLMAHSMGNVVAGEALRLAGTNQVVNTYISMQGAIASHTYDPTTPTRPLTLLGVSWDSSTPDRYANYSTNGAPCYFNASAGAGTYVNFFNTNDYALVQLWEPNQDFKPDNGGFSYPGYFYSVSSLHTNGFYYQFGSGTNDFHNLNFPGDTYTIFSYCDEARSHALGAQADVGGVFQVNGIDQQVNLRSSPYNFLDAHKYHSGEFRSDNAQRAPFWNTVLVQMGLKD